ncbi:MAG: AAA family ATPase [Gammaproteobacteria bacterium]
MSIIERALNKLQKSDAAGNPENSVATRLPRPPGSRRDSTEPLAAPRGGPSRPREPRARTVTVELNVKSLREQGAMPPEEFANALTDQFRRIKWPILETRIETQGGSRLANRLMITSSVASEGKTFTSLNMALSMAREKDYSVLLVDADVAKRHTTDLLSLGDQPGLTDALADSTIDVESLVAATSVPGLCVLPAGRRTSSAPELFASHRMVEVIEALGSYDPQRVVLFDTSPLLVTNESQVLSKIIDQIVLVVRAEYTTQPMVLEAIGLLDSTKTVRCILNQARASRMTEYYYGYGYHQNGQE